MRLVTTTALALALAAPGYAVLAQEKAPEAKTGAQASGGMYMAKADKTDVFGSDFLGKDVFVKQSPRAEAQGEAAQEMSEAQDDAREELAEGQEDASEEMADAQGEGAEERAEAQQDASEEMADAQSEAQQEVAEANEDASEEMAEADDGPEWESIGEISDVVMTREGDVKAVLVDIGGFLGMGAKTVAITMEELAWQTEEGDEEPFLVLKTDRAALENAPEFDREPEADMDRAAVDSAETATTPGALPSAGQAMNTAETETEQAMNETGEALDEAADETAEAADDAAESVETAAEETGAAIDEAATETAQEMDEATDEAAQETAEATDGTSTGMTDTAAAPAGEAGRLTKMDAAGYRQVEAAGLTAETVEGATVYDMGNEDIGEVVDLVLSAEGAIDEAIIDVGGFLGLGEHRVAVRMGDLKIMQSDDDPEDLRVYVASTKEELEQMPEVDIDG